MRVVTPRSEEFNFCSASFCKATLSNSWSISKCDDSSTTIRLVTCCHLEPPCCFHGGSTITEDRPRLLDRVLHKFLAFIRAPWAPPPNDPPEDPGGPKLELPALL